MTGVQTCALPILGLSVVAFGLIIWIVILMVKDPLGVVRKTVLNK